MTLLAHDVVSVVFWSQQGRHFDNEEVVRKIPIQFQRLTNVCGDVISMVTRRHFARREEPKIQASGVNHSK